MSQRRLISIFGVIAMLFLAGCGENEFLPEDIPLKADLLPVELKSVEPEFVGGSTSTVTVLIRNQGALAAKAFDVRVALMGDPGYFSESQVTATTQGFKRGLPGGYAGNVAVGMTIPRVNDGKNRPDWFWATFFAIRVEVDSGFDVTEVNVAGTGEDNNIFDFNVEFDPTSVGFFKNG